jgi:Recombination endonuclease VII
MPGRAKCPPGCDCEKHSRARMTDDQRRQRQREKSGAHYAANKEVILERQRQKRRDPVAGEELRARERQRVANLTPAERERRAQLNRDWYRRNPRPNAENVRQHLRHRYGLSPEQRGKLLTEQNGCCYLCGEPLDLDHPRTVHVDHDHTCCPGSRTCGACIRGIACDPCNRGIGYFRDDPGRMRRVADQLEAAMAALAARRAAGPVQEALPLDVAAPERKTAS